jgi:hypothetical protein
VKSVDLGITNISYNQLDDARILNKKLYIVPDWNKEFGIVFNELYVEEYVAEKSLFFPKTTENIEKYCIHYNITGEFNRTIPTECGNHVISFAIFVVDNKNRIYSKEWLTSINLKDKYSIASGENVIESKIAVSDINYIVVVPEIGDISKSGQSSKPFDSYSWGIEPVCQIDSFQPLNCKIKVEESQICYSCLDIKISDVFLWGYEKTILYCFFVEGKSSFSKGYFLGNNYIIAMFDEKNRLIDTINIFIGKKGYTGPRGGVYDTFIHEGKIRFEYFDCNNIKVDVQSIHKVIITQSK